MNGLGKGGDYGEDNADEGKKEDGEALLPKHTLNPGKRKVNTDFDESIMYDEEGNPID